MCQKLDQTPRIILKVIILSRGTGLTLGSLDSLETENIGLTFTLISIDHAPDMIGKEKLFTSK
jgi:hypothetical protein